MKDTKLGSGKFREISYPPYRLHNCNKNFIQFFYLLFCVLLFRNFSHHHINLTAEPKFFVQMIYS
jgi:hypothetical protein